jgi:hypothetical protein
VSKHSEQFLRAPFPYFGGKSRAAALIWSRFGDVVNYVEPFAGSLAVLLQRPRPFAGSETVNDKDGLISNFWRALASDPDEVARHADWPVNECDLHARHLWLVHHRDELTLRLMADPDYYDAKAAGWWVWGICCWIGSGWCSGNGAWGVGVDADGHRQLVHLGDEGQGVHRQLVHLGDEGQGVHRQLVHLGNEGQGVHRQRAELYVYFEELAERLRGVRVCCGDWARVTGPSVTSKHGLTAILLDPPYDARERQPDLYTQDAIDASASVREWAIEHGDEPLMRIALCGYEGEHEMPDSWECVRWKARGGFDGQNRDRDNQNRKRERVWFSPHCLKARQGSLFA